MNKFKQEIYPQQELLENASDSEAAYNLSLSLIEEVIGGVTENEREQMRQYFSYYLDHFKEFNDWAEEELKDHSVFGKILKEIPKQFREEQNKISVELQKNAILKDDWSPYSQHLITQGIAYAKMGLEFHAWYEVVNLLRSFLTPKMLKENHGFSAYAPIHGMNRFIDIAMCFIGEAYLFEKKRIVEEQKIQAENLNAQLEQFTYLASHDLREPLQTVKSFIALLQNELTNISDGSVRETSGQYLSFIQKSIERMNSLITGLLNYSRLGKSGSLEQVDLNEIVNDVLDDMKASIEESKAEITVDKLPVIVGFRAEIKQLFQNLLSNAIKFRKKNETPLITIKAVKKNGSYHFSVSDNGIGIDEKFYPKIFEIFNRLHSPDEYAGSGIGLSYCKKIVELHKGIMWVESKVGKGSTFHFLLPEKQ